MKNAFREVTNYKVNANPGDIVQWEKEVQSDKYNNNLGLYNSQINELSKVVKGISHYSEKEEFGEVIEYTPDIDRTHVGIVESYDYENDEVTILEISGAVNGLIYGKESGSNTARKITFKGKEVHDAVMKVISSSNEAKSVLLEYANGDLKSRERKEEVHVFDNYIGQDASPKTYEAYLDFKKSHKNAYDISYFTLDAISFDEARGTSYSLSDEEKKNNPMVYRDILVFEYKEGEEE